MTRIRQLRDRYAEIIAELSRLSRDGWRNAFPNEYESLERELRELAPLVIAARSRRVHH